ncbi:MAG: magnesium-translocating P-type ATPase [Burkholderiaceae bacterium]|jgi:Mg2+-importing ATPase|nr:magnesium-translocating P-type ATPase [Burkholderiaceae bacterium]
MRRSSNVSAATITPPWAVGIDAALQRLATTTDGLPEDEARRRLADAGPPPRLRRAGALGIFLRQFKSPLVLILVFAAAVSILTRDWLDAAIVLLIVLASAVLSFQQEYRAGRAVERLLARIAPSASVLRDGRQVAVPPGDLVAGDVLVLSAGSLIAADARVIDADDFFVTQAVLTGETFPVEKQPAPVDAEASLAERTNVVFKGTNVRSGTARAVVFATGGATEYGAIADRLALRAPETEFERGIRHFGQLLTQLMTLLVLGIFAVNVAYDRPVTESLMFAVALAVGLAPELLPAVISLTLARGAQRMAAGGVIVRRLAAIENFGAMDVLCTDKTGTLTAGVVRLDRACNAQGEPSTRVQDFAAINAALQTGLPNALDAAIGAASPGLDLARWDKTEEIPYDFVRKRLSVAVRRHAHPGGENLLITKGALEPVLATCARVHGEDGALRPERHAALIEQAARWGDQGYRVLGVATRNIESRPQYTAADEADMRFEGYLLFFDPPKDDAATAIRDLAALGVDLKVITGDSRRVALHVASMVGLPVEGVLTGADLHAMREEALWQHAERTTVFAEVDPNQKERIIQALRRTGHVVGYLGDGINDAPALHAADVGISVDSAVDVAKETADLVLLQHSLTVLREGIEEGRRVFANTMKYVYTTTSANFGNMLSMAALSLVIPFLPLLPKQILLNNFLSDLPAMALAGDRVDPETVGRPRRWDVARIRNFMLVFGGISSVFDLLTFAVLLLVIRAAPPEFRTAWFVESLLTELSILLVVRTQRPLLGSRPSIALTLSTALVALAAVALPYLPLARTIFDFVPLPPALLAVVLLITLLYTAASEAAKHRFFRSSGA